MEGAIAGVYSSAFLGRLHKHTPPPLSVGDSHRALAFSKVPLSRGGAIESAAAGVCSPAFLCRLYKHTPPPLSRGDSHGVLAFFLILPYFFFPHIAVPVLSKPVNTNVDVILFSQSRSRSTFNL
jgi:hypothetical protein